MASTTNTTFLNLTLPVPTVQLGPTWATQINAAFEVIDAHDHTSGKGVQIPTAGLNINADLDFNDFAAENVQLVSLTNKTAVPTGLSFSGSVSIANGDLYYTNTAGIAVQLTSGGSLPAAPGSADTFDFQNVSSNITISSGDDTVFLAVDTSADRIVTLPLASSVVAGRIYIIKDSTGNAFTNNITLAVQGSDTIDGNGSSVIDSGFGSKLIIGNGVDQWYIA